MSVVCVFRPSSLQAFAKLYIHILKTGSAALEQILVRLRDHANEPCLIHCTGVCFYTGLSILSSYLVGGKDRSGVFAAVVLKVRLVSLIAERARLTATI